MPESLFSNVIEVKQLTHARAATEYMEHGYELLHLSTVNELREIEGRRTLIKRVAYVVGRRVGVPAYVMPSMAERLAREAAEAEAAGLPL